MEGPKDATGLCQAAAKTLRIVVTPSLSQGELARESQLKAL